MKYGVRANITPVVKWLKDYPPNIRGALASAINKAAKQGRNVASRAITTRYAIKASRVKKGITVTRRARKGSLMATITAQGRVPGLQNYSARRTKRGITVMVKKGNRKLIPGGFVSPGADGKGVGLFVGTGIKTVPKRGRYKGRKIITGPRAGEDMTREFLERKFGPSLQALFRTRGRPEAQKFIRDNLPRIVNQEIRFRLKRAAEKAKATSK